MPVRSRRAPTLVALLLTIDQQKRGHINPNARHRDYVLKVSAPLCLDEVISHRNEAHGVFHRVIRPLEVLLDQLVADKMINRLNSLPLSR